MQREDTEVALAARGYLYQLFQSAFGQKPVVAIPAFDASVALQAFEAIGAEGVNLDRARAFCEAIAACQDDGAAMAMAESRYMPLLEGPGAPKANPWESMFLAAEPRMFGEVTLAVRKTYRSFGVEPQMGEAVADDHIALELGFMGELAARLSGCFADGGVLDEGSLKGSADFLDLHLLKWAGRFAGCVVEAEEKAGAEGDFYAAAADALVVFLHNDRRLLEGLGA